MNGSPPTWLLTAIFVPVVGLFLYRRFRSSFGRQRISPPRMAIRVGLLLLVGTLLLVATHGGIALGAAVGGLAAGLALSVVGVRHTKLERTAEGSFYTPNRWVGIGVTALLLGRLAARMFMAYSAVAEHAALPQDPLAGAQQNPFTMGIFFLMIGYYTAYYGMVLRRSHTMLPSAAPVVTQSSIARIASSEVR